MTEQNKVTPVQVPETLGSALAQTERSRCARPTSNFMEGPTT
jgi:hypothetical protein